MPDGSAQPSQRCFLTPPYRAGRSGEFNDKGLVYIRLGEPTDRIVTVSGEANTLKSSLGVALHDSSWTPIVNQVNVLRLPARNDPTAASVNAIRFTVPPDS